MAHPKLTGRVDRRTLMAAGTAALLFGAPAAAAGAPLGDAATDCTVEDVLDDRCEETAPVTQAVEPVTEAAEPVMEAAEPVTDPVEKVVDDIVKQAPPAPDPGTDPGPGPDPITPPPTPIPVLPDPGGPTTPTDPGPGTPAAPGTTDGTLGVAGPVGVSMLPRTVAVNTTGGFEPATPLAAGRASSLIPTAPVISSPYAGSLPSIAEDLVSSSRAPLAAGAEAFTAPLSGMNPAPDASSWLLATAGGLLLLVGAGHLTHARQRFTATVAR